MLEKKNVLQQDKTYKRLESCLTWLLSSYPPAELKES